MKHSTCSTCGAEVLLYRRSFAPLEYIALDPTPAPSDHPLALAVAGQLAYTPSGLVEFLYEGRPITRDQAVIEASERPHHLPHDCEVST